MKISDAANTAIPAYLVLREMGFDVRVNRSADGESWHATRGEHEYSAEDTVTLLGLVAMHEARGQDWKATDEQIDAFTAEYYSKS